MLGYLDDATSNVLQIASVKTGINLIDLVSQGGHSTSVEASGRTHAGNGAADILTSSLSTQQVLSILTAIRDQGNATAWYRNWSTKHIHVAVYTAGMDPSLESQFKDYVNGGNGLGGKDDGPRNPAAIARAAQLAGMPPPDANNVQNVVTTQNTTSTLGMLGNLFSLDIMSIVKIVLGIALLAIAVVRITTGDGDIVSNVKTAADVIGKVKK